MRRIAIDMDEILAAMLSKPRCGLEQAAGSLLPRDLRPGETLNAVPGCVALRPARPAPAFCEPQGSSQRLCPMHGLDPGGPQHPREQ